MGTLSYQNVSQGCHWPTISQVGLNLHNPNRRTILIILQSTIKQFVLWFQPWLLLQTQQDIVVLYYYIIRMVEKLTPSQIEEFRMAYNLFDKDGDDTISIKELGIIMRSLGQNPTEAELDELIRDIDQDKNGTLSFDQFLELMARQIEYSTNEDQLIQMFKIFDRDSNGLISANEIMHVMNGLGQKMDMEGARKMIQEANLDGDGSVNYEQFRRILKKK